MSARWRPSHYVERFTAEIIEKSSPEFYKARIRHFEDRVKQKIGEKLHQKPIPAPAAAPAKVAGLSLEKAFNKPELKPLVSQPFAAPQFRPISLA